MYLLSSLCTACEQWSSLSTFLLSMSSALARPLFLMGQAQVDLAPFFGKSSKLLNWHELILYNMNSTTCFYFLGERCRPKLPQNKNLGLLIYRNPNDMQINRLATPDIMLFYMFMKQIGTDLIHIGVLTFSTDARLRFQLQDYFREDELLKAMDTIKFVDNYSSVCVLHNEIPI